MYDINAYNWDLLTIMSCVLPDPVLFPIKQCYTYGKFYKQKCYYKITMSCTSKISSQSSQSSPVMDAFVLSAVYPGPNFVFNYETINEEYIE